MLAITKMDRERADFEKVISDVKEIFKVKPVVLQLPIGKEAGFKGVVDLLSMKALTFDGDGRNVSKADIPADMKEEAQSRRDVLIEDLAEVDDALMERYLEGGELGADELAAALQQGILNKVFVPAVLCSGMLNRGIQPILDLIADACPSPAEMPAVVGRTKDRRGSMPESLLRMSLSAHTYSRLWLIRTLGGSLYFGSSPVSFRPIRISSIPAEM